MVSIGNTLNRTRRVLAFILSATLLTIVTSFFGNLNVRAVAQATPTPTYSSSAPTLRLGSQVITPENADRIRLLSRIGRGLPLNFDWSPDGKMLFIDTELGTWQYQFDHLDAEPTLIPSVTVMSQPVASSPDRKLYFVVVKGQLELIDLQGNILLKFDMRIFYQPSAIAFMPDGRSFAIKGRDGIDIWDISTLTPYLELVDTSGADLAEEMLKFSPDGKKLYDYGIEYQRDESGGIPPSVVTVLGWDLTTTQQITIQRVQFPQQIQPRSLIFDPVHSAVAISVGGSVLVWRILANHLMLPASATQPPDATIEALYGGGLVMAFSPDGNMLATGNEAGLSIWDMNSGTMIAQPATFDGSIGNWPVKLEFSPDRKTLAFTTIDGSVRLWDVNTRRDIAALDGYSQFDHQVAMSSDGRLLAVGNNAKASVQLWDLQSGQWRHTFPGSWNVTFNPDGKELAIYNGANGLQIWDTADYLLRKSYDTHTSNCAENFGVIAFSPDWKTLAVAVDGSTLALCDLVHGTQLATIHMRLLEQVTGQIERITFSPDGKTLAFVAAGDDIVFVDLPTQHAFDIPGIQGSYICFSPDGRTLAYSTVRGIQLLDLSNNKVRRLFDFQPDNQAMPTIQFSPDGRLLLAFEGPDTKLWDTTTGSLVVSFPNYSGRTAMFSPDGKTLILTTYGSIEFWGIPDWPYF